MVNLCMGEELEYKKEEGASEFVFERNLKPRKTPQCFCGVS